MGLPVVAVVEVLLLAILKLQAAMVEALEAMLMVVVELEEPSMVVLGLLAQLVLMTSAVKVVVEVGVMTMLPEEMVEMVELREAVEVVVEEEQTPEAMAVMGEMVK
jgi:hypothetical protein